MKLFDFSWISKTKKNWTYWSQIRDQRDQIWIIETETGNVWVSITRSKTETVRVSMTRPRPSLNDETEKMQVSMTRSRLQMCESQLQECDRDWKIRVSITRPRLKKSESQKRDWTKDIVTETPSRLLLIPLVGRGMIFSPWNEFCRIRVFWLVGLDFML